MRLKMPAVLFLVAALLAGCIAGEATPRSDRSPPQEPPAPVIEPAESRAGEEIFVDNPDSPYPMTVESWSVDMDGDGTEELVELRAEKGYFSNETEPDKWFDGLSRVLDVYAVAFQDGKPVFLPVPEDGLESMPERWIEWYN